jgi:predicted nucleic acid-binding Zn finger protein
MGQAEQIESRDPVKLMQMIRDHEAMTAIEKRGNGLFGADNNDPASGTSAYRACVFLDEEGRTTSKYQVGKPIKQGQGDYTAKFGGPYIVDIVLNTCTCPSCSGVHLVKDGRMVTVRDGKGTCKHLIGLHYKLAESDYELVSMKGVTDRKLLVWKERIKKEENDG